MSISITHITFNDFPDWLPMWDANNLGTRNAAVTAETWARLNDPESSVKGLIARRGNLPAGILHYVLHPVTGHIEPACYMQDLYTNEEYRRKGIGLKLVKALHAIGRDQKWARIYWLADNSNMAAQALYRKIGMKLNFSLHILPI